MKMVDGQNTQQQRKFFMADREAWKYYLAALIFWALVWALISVSHFRFLRRQAEAVSWFRGQLLCDIILHTHAHDPNPFVNGDAPLRTLIPHFWSDDVIKSPFLSKATFRIETAFQNAHGQLGKDRDNPRLLVSNVLTEGELSFRLGKLPSYATYKKSVIPAQSCFQCKHDVTLSRDKPQIGILVNFPTDDLLLEYNQNIFYYVCFYMIIGFSLSLLTIFIIYRTRSRFLSLQATTARMMENGKMASLGLIFAGFSNELKTRIGLAMVSSSQVCEDIKKMSETFKRNEIIERKEITEAFLSLKDSAHLVSTHFARTMGMIDDFQSTSIDFSFSEKQTIVFQKFFENLMIDLEFLHKNKNVYINIFCPPSIEIIANISVIKVIMYNLYTNAIKHAFWDGGILGTITIECVHVAEKIKIIFNDDGCGMDSLTLKHLFDPFFKTKNGKGKTGLGMFIVYKLVTVNLGGSIKCQSKLGQGTRIELLLPNGQPGGTIN